MIEEKNMTKEAEIQKFINIAIRNFLSATDNMISYLRNFNCRPYLSGLLLAAPLLLYSCLGGGGSQFRESPTSGNIRIVADESFQPIIDDEIYIFTNTYNNAKIEPVYLPEVDVINYFMNDSVKVMVTSKKLTESQIKYLRDTLVVARTTTFAYDGLALITNKANNDTLLRYETVSDIFRGNITSWKEVNPKSGSGRINVIFDNTKSGNIRYFKEVFEIEGALGDNFFAVNNNPEVVDYVSRNPDALGVISVNWISDRYDSLSNSFTKKVNIVAVSKKYFNDGTYYRPYQASIYERSYPFVREVYMISRETFSGLGSGFIQWATAEQGQRIVLKSGLVPATMPVRLVQIRK